MNKKTAQLKEAWTKREQKLGKTKQAVLFKRFPVWLNNYIHHSHVQFIIHNLPQTSKKILDVGCGYGRISQELKNVNKKREFQGIELCEEFANNYEEQIGPCFKGPVQHFTSNSSFDVILIVTLLMYVDQDEQFDVLLSLWSKLKVNGVIICIEPAMEFMNLWRFITNKNDASPTGGDLSYFSLNQLKSLVSKLPGCEIIATRSFSLISKPLTLHHGIVVKKVSH